MLCDCLSHNGFLTGRGYAEAAQREAGRGALDAMDMFGYLDCTVSVSALVEVEVDAEDVPEHNELFLEEGIHNGS